MVFDLETFLHKKSETRTASMLGKFLPSKMKATSKMKGQDKWRILWGFKVGFLEFLDFGASVKKSERKWLRAFKRMMKIDDDEEFTDE